MLTERLISAGGLVAFIGLAWACSEQRRTVNWRLVLIALGLQFGLGLLVLRTAAGEHFFAGVRSAFSIVTGATEAGASFVFGALTDVIVLNPDVVAGTEGPFLLNASLAFKVLPIVIVVSCLAAILYHLRAIQVAVRGMAWLMHRTLKTSGAETFGASLLVFLGVEAMPAVKAYLKTMTRSELLTVMTAFMATVAADVMVIYATFGADPGHLLAASLMSAPAAILMAKILVPETETPSTLGSVNLDLPVESHNVIDASARGASEGLTLALNIGALLIAFISLIYLVNLAFSSVIGISFTEVAGWCFVPFAFLMGVPLADVAAVGQLLGTKTIINEFIAYSDMNGLIAAGELSPRSVTIATYALCGFANPGSLGIMIACLTGLVPERRREITQLGLRSVLGGTLAVFMTACVAGILS